MKTITKILASAAIFAGIFTACSDLSDLEKRVDSLESRVSALEKVIPSLNSNIEGLQALMNAGTINSAAQANGVWTITLSSGETISLTEGSIGVGNASIMSVDKDGY
jgi:outer membrane murein-binding lipoprotein Lpp